MIAKQFSDSVSGVLQKINSVALSLGHQVRVFNSALDFAEVGIVFEHSTKGINLILFQVLRVNDEIRLTCSPWYKSWRGSRIVVPNLNQDEALEFIQQTFLPELEKIYQKVNPDLEINKGKSWFDFLKLSWVKALDFLRQVPWQFWIFVLALGLAVLIFVRYM